MKDYLIYSIVTDNTAYLARVIYVFEFIQNHVLANGRIQFVIDPVHLIGDTIQYTAKIKVDDTSVFCIPAQNVIFSDSSFNRPLFANKFLYKKNILWSVEENICAPAAFLKSNRFSFDIIETIFFHLSRYEERFCPEHQKDEHGRMLPEHQFLVRNGIHHIPVVDHLVFCFLEAIGAEPQRLNTSIQISTDVDLVRKFLLVPPLRSTFKYVFVKPSITSMMKLWGNFFMTKFGLTKDPYLIFEWMFRTASGFERTAYFLVNGTSAYDKPYPKINREFSKIVSMAKDKGWEIGIHPSYCTAKDVDLMKAEKNRLERIIGGQIGKSRQHFLHFSFPETADFLEQAGIQEDASLGYSNFIGFRCGTGFPYHLYNFEEERPSRFVEVPLVVMDVALLREAKKRNKKPLKLMKEFLEANQELTSITFNFHNSTFFDASLDGIDLYELYNHILQWDKV